MNQSWIFIGRTDAEAETSILWPPDVKNWLIGKDPDAGKDWGREEKGTTEDEMVDDITDSMDMGLSKLWEFVMDREAWHAAACPQGCKELDATEQLNWTEAFLRTVQKGDSLLHANLSCILCSLFIIFGEKSEEGESQKSSHLSTIRTSGYSGRISGCLTGEPDEVKSFPHNGKCWCT